MTGEPPSSYAVELRPYSDKYSHTTPGQYLEIPIPDEVEQLGVEHGDTVYLDFVADGDPSHIRISFSDTGTRHDLKLKYRDDRYPRHAVTFPTEYTVTRDDSPFQGIGRDETVTVEFNYGLEPEIRVYTEDGYRKRTAELVSDDLTPTIKAPVLASLFNIFRTKPDINLTQKARVRGDGFKFILFDSLDPAITEERKKRLLPDGVNERDFDPQNIIRISELKRLYYSGALDTDFDAVINIRWLKESPGSEDSKLYEYANSDSFEGSYRAILPRNKKTNIVISTENEKLTLNMYRENGMWVVDLGDTSVKRPSCITPSSDRYQDIFLPVPIKKEGKLDWEGKMYLQKNPDLIPDWDESTD